MLRFISFALSLMRSDRIRHSGVRRTPAAISQVRLFNTHPTGKALAKERLSALMGDGGIQECSYAQNCVEICPKDIALTTSIADVGRQVMKKAILDFFKM
jgi:succinate dehydrogenase / fumarate reductase iron-sulfur subunit